MTIVETTFIAIIIYIIRVKQTGCFRETGNGEFTRRTSIKQTNSRLRKGKIN